MTKQKLSSECFHIRQELSFGQCYGWRHTFHGLFSVFSEMLQTLTSMLSVKQEFVWGPAQQPTFDKWEDVHSSQHNLATYDVHRDTIVIADASSFCLGAVIALRRRQRPVPSYRLRLKSTQ